MILNSFETGHFWPV